MNKYLKKVGDFVKKHKKKFVVGGLALAGTLAGAWFLTKDKTENDEETIVLPNESNNDKIYDMQFVDPETNEVVWKLKDELEECHQHYVDDFRNQDR